MNSLAMAKSYIRQAEERVKHAKEAFSGGNYPYTIRQCQEAVELALKAALRLVGIEPPKVHDVGPILRKNKNLFPEWFKGNIDRMASISRTLRRERETSMYGDEELSLPPEDIYSKMDAEFALESCEFVLKNCKKLVEELTQGTSSRSS